MSWLSEEIKGESHTMADHTDQCVCGTIANNELRDKCRELKRCIAYKPRPNCGSSGFSKEIFVGCMVDYLVHGVSLLELRRKWKVNANYVYKKLALLGIKARTRTEAARLRYGPDGTEQAPERKLIPYAGKVKPNGESW